MSTPGAERIAIRRVWLAGGAALVLSLLANAIVRTVMVVIFSISPLFRALETWDTIIIFTLVGVFGATVVFAILSRLTKHAIKLFRWLAGFLLICFVHTEHLDADVRRPRRNPPRRDQPHGHARHNRRHHRGRGDC